MILAAEVVPPDMTGWVVGFVLTSIVGALGFLIRSALGKLETGVEGLGVKMDAMRDMQARGDTRMAVMEAKVEALARERLEDRAALAELRREMKELSEGVSR